MKEGSPRLRDLPEDPFDDVAMRDFGGPYAKRELPSDRWSAQGGLYRGRAPRSALPASIRAAKLTMYLQAGLLVLLFTPVHQSDIPWAILLWAPATAMVSYCGIAMRWGRPSVRQVAIWLELALLAGSAGLTLMDVTGAILGAGTAIVVLSMLLARSAAELNQR